MSSSKNYIVKIYSEQPLNGVWNGYIKIDIYENITIPRLKNLTTESIKEVIELLANLPVHITDVMKKTYKNPVVKEPELNNMIEYLKNIIKKGE